MLYLSIIIPVYNVEKYLELCLDSAICGPVGEYEIVTVNDGSTDSSPDILNKYSSDFPELIKIVNKPNGGLGSARNAGIKAASGKYLMFLDSDDYLTPGAVDEMLDVCRKDDFDICIFDADQINEEGRVLEHITGANITGSFSLESNPDLLLCRMNACNKLFLRKLFTDNNIYFKDREWYEDVSCVPKFYPYARNIIYVQKTWYKYLLRSGSIMNSSRIERNLEIINAVEETVGYYKSLGVYGKYQKQFEYMAFYNVLVAASVRINLTDCSSPLQKHLKEWFLANYPEYKSNPYYKSAGMKYKLLDFFIVHDMYGMLHAVMSLNNKLRH